MMIKFIKPNQLEGLQLRQELRNNGVEISDEVGAVRIEEENLFLAIDESKKELAQQVLNTHIPKPRPEPTIEEKLALVGLNLDDLKEALGL